MVGSMVAIVGTVENVNGMMVILHTSVRLSVFHDLMNRMINQ